MKRMATYKNKSTWNDFFEAGISLFLFGTIMAMATVGGLMFEDLFVAARVIVCGQ